VTTAIPEQRPTEEGKAMTEKVYMVGAYVENTDPLLRVRRFIPLTTEYPTLAEAVAGAEQDYRPQGTRSWR
jgi:hypothetical protein